MNIHGITDYEEKKRNFIYDNWELEILPREIMSDVDYFREVMNRSTHHKVIYGTKEIEAYSANNMYAKFNVDDFSSLQNGMIVYKVNSFILASDYNLTESISAFQIAGKFVDHFFPPYAETTSEFDRSKVTQGFTYNIKPFNSREFKFMFADRLFTLEFVVSVGKIQSVVTEVPSAHSFIRIDVDKPLSFSEFTDFMHRFMNIFSFINYTKEITIDTIELLSKQDGLYLKSGLAKIKKLQVIDDLNTRLSEVKYGDFDKDSEELSSLIHCLMSDEINLDFIALNQYHRNYYSKLRFIEVIASFEKNFGDHFSNYALSEKYVIVKNDLQSYIEDKTNDESIEKKIRKAYESFSKSIQNFNPLIQKLQYFGKDKDFACLVEMIFGDEIRDLNEINERLSFIRNEIAHGKTNIDIKDIDFTCFQYIVLGVYYLIALKASLSRKTILQILPIISRRI